MKMKRFVDTNMRQVLRRVREDQGPDAVILSNRRVEDGIEIIAAVDYDEALIQQALGAPPPYSQTQSTALETSAIENKAPGKDVSAEDLESKFPLAAKKSADHKSGFEVNGVEFGGVLIPVFAGPNMVESEELIVATAKAVQSRGAQFLRGGAFKPLSFPRQVTMTMSLLNI